MLVLTINKVKFKIIHKSSSLILRAREAGSGMFTVSRKIMLFGVKPLSNSV